MLYEICRHIYWPVLLTLGTDKEVTGLDQNSAIKLLPKAKHVAHLLEIKEIEAQLLLALTLIDENQLSALAIVLR